MTHADAPIPPTASLLETMRLEGGAVARLERHLARMRQSASLLSYPWREQALRDAIASACRPRGEGVWRVRLLVDTQGQPAVTCTEHRDTSALWRIAFANFPVESSDPRLTNKTTAREPYDIARRGRPDVDDVVLWNERGEVTESTIANIVVEVDGVRCTPPIACGLLPGVLRAELLERGEIVERVLTRGVIARAPQVWLINSLRGWMEALLIR